MGREGLSLTMDSLCSSYMGKCLGGKEGGGEGMEGRRAEEGGGEGMEGRGNREKGEGRGREERGGY
jgi:hypothetical protein